MPKKNSNPSLITTTISQASKPAQSRRKAKATTSRVVWGSNQVFVAFFLCQFSIALAQREKDRSPSQPMAPPSPELKATIKQAKNLSSGGHAESAISLLEKALAKAKTGKKDLDERVAAMSLADIEGTAGHTNKTHEAFYQALESGFLES